MKMEHKAVIDRAKLSGVAPSDLAHELTVHDLVEAALFEIKNIHAPWSKLNEGSQQEVITRLTDAATESVYRAIAIISSRSVDTIPLTVHNADFKQKAIKITASVDAHDPNRAGLIDVAGKLCLLVLAPTDYVEGLDFIQPDRDQHDLPLHVSDLTGSLFDKRPTGPDEPDGEHPLGSAAELAERTGGNTDAEHDMHDVGQTQAVFEKEFGEFTYDDAKQLIVLKSNSKAFKGHWVQSRLAIDSDKTATLLLRLLDDKVLEIETEGESAFDHSFKVIATLDEVV